MEKSYNHLSKRKRIKIKLAPDRPAALLLFYFHFAIRRRRGVCFFSFLKRFRGSFFVNERVLPCAYIMKAKTRSSEVIHKSNDPRRLRRLRTVFTDEVGGDSEKNKASRTTLTSIFSERGKTIRTIHTEAWRLCRRDTNRERENRSAKICGKALMNKTAVQWLKISVRDSR